MPEPGEIRKGNEIGRDNYNKYIWHACIDCQKERWVDFRKGKIIHSRCPICARKAKATRTKISEALRCEKSPNWKGGKKETRQGYILVKLHPQEDFFRPMLQANGYVLEHRLVVAKAIKRNLQSWEFVHHLHAKYPKGSIEDKHDNRYPENLQLISDDRHNQITILENKIDRLEIKINDLIKEIRLLRWENKELREEKNSIRS